MRIRAMTPDDYDAVYALWCKTPGIGLRRVDDAAAGIERFLARNPGMSFVAEHEGGVVGAVLCGHDGRRGQLYHMAVDASMRRSGVGRGLIDAATQALRACGVTRVNLLASCDNGEGNAFWASLGFSKRADLVCRSLSLDDANET